MNIKLVALLKMATMNLLTLQYMLEIKKPLKTYLTIGKKTQMIYMVK